MKIYKKEMMTYSVRCKRMKKARKEEEKRTGKKQYKLGKNVGLYRAIRANATVLGELET